MWLFGYFMICFSFLQAGGGTQSYLRYMKIWNMKYENLKHEIWKIETINWEKVTLQLLAIFSARGKYVALSSAPTKKSSLPYFLVIFPCHIFVPYFLAIFPCHICVPYFLAIFLSEGNILRFHPLHPRSLFHCWPSFIFYWRDEHFSHGRLQMFTPSSQPFLDFCLGLKHVFGHNFHYFLDGNIWNVQSHGKWTVRDKGLKFVSFKITSYHFSSGKIWRKQIILVSQNILSEKLLETSSEVILLPFWNHWCTIVIIILSSVKLIIFNHQSLGRLRRQILPKFHWSRFLSTLSHICISNICFKCISPHVCTMCVFIYTCM